MSVYYSAKLIVGYTYEDFVQIVQSNQKYEHVTDSEDLDLERVSPYFDADDSDCIFGVEVAQSGDYSFNMIDPVKILEAYENIVKDLFEKFGVKPVLYLTSQGG